MCDSLILLLRPPPPNSLHVPNAPPPFSLAFLQIRVLHTYSPTGPAVTQRWTTPSGCLILITGVCLLLLLWVAVGVYLLMK